MTGPCVVFAVHGSSALTNARTALIQQFLTSNWEVVLATADNEASRALCASGAQLESVAFHGDRLAPLADLKAFRRLSVIYGRWQPVLIQHFHTKPIILGTLAARWILGDSVRITNTVNGLGSALTTNGLSAWMAKLGYTAGMSRSDVAILPNREDRQLFLEKGWIARDRTRLIANAEVDAERFSFMERQNRSPEESVVVLISSLLKQKGLIEFAEVARRIRERWPGIRFRIAGEEAPGHPHAISANWLSNQPGVEYLGPPSNIQPLLAEADLLLFPSHDPEETPETVLEAAATGLPVVGFDVPGVREAVRTGETGYLVPDRDVWALTDRVAALLENEALRLGMGLSARRMVEEAFAIETIKAQYIRLYRELGAAV